MRLVHVEAEGDKAGRLVNVERITTVAFSEKTGKLGVSFSDDERFFVLTGEQARDLWNFLKAEATPARAPGPEPAKAAEPDGWKHATCEDDKPFPCRYCGGIRVYFQECGGDHEDYRYHCRDCNKMWVYEGADA